MFRTTSRKIRYTDSQLETVVRRQPIQRRLGWMALFLAGFAVQRPLIAQNVQPALTEAISAVLLFRASVLQDSTPVDLCSLRILIPDSAALSHTLQASGARAHVVRNVIPSIPCSSRTLWDSRRYANIALSAYREDSVYGSTVDAMWVNGEYSHAEEYHFAGGVGHSYVDSYRQFRFLQELLLIPPPPKPQF